MEQFRHILVGWVVDGSGGPVQRGILMEVSKGMVVSLAEADPEDLTQGRVEDLRSFTLLPGLVDAHVHLAMSGTDDPERRERQRRASFQEAATGIRRRLKAHLANGVVAVRDGGDGCGHVLLYKKRFIAEETLPPVVKAAGEAWHAPGRYGSLIGRTPRPGETLAGAIAGVGPGSDHVKIVNSGLNSLSRYGEETAPQFSLEELRAAVRSAHASGRKVMVHANGRIPVGLAVEAGCDSIEHGFFMGRENLKKMAERQTVWIPTVFTMAAYREELPGGSKESEVAKRNLDHQLDQIRLARSLGVPIGVGTDAGSLGVNHGRAFRRELQLLIAAGFTLKEAVKSATALGSALLGVEEHTGILAPGRPATFVAVKAEPEGLMKGLKSPQFVVVKGEVASLESLRHCGGCCLN